MDAEGKGGWEFYLRKRNGEVREIISQTLTFQKIRRDEGGRG